MGPWGAAGREEAQASWLSPPTAVCLLAPWQHGFCSHVLFLAVFPFKPTLRKKACSKIIYYKVQKLLLKNEILCN